MLLIKSSYVFLLLFTQSYLIAQYDSISSILPVKYRTGIIVYPYNDSLIFVFKSSEYVEILMEDIESIPKTRKEIFRLADTLYFAAQGNLTIIRNNEYTIFPNQIILMELLLRKNIIVLLKRSGHFEKLEYRSQKKHGAFSAFGKSSKMIFFDIVYNSHEIR